MTGIPLIRTSGGRLYQRIRGVLDEFDDDALDKIDVLIGCASQLISRIPDVQEREDYAALCALLLRKRVRMRFAANN
jgi:hypothetical protein